MKYSIVSLVFTQFRRHHVFHLVLGWVAVLGLALVSHAAEGPSENEHAAASVPTDCFLMDPTINAFVPKPGCVFHEKQPVSGARVTYRINSDGLRGGEIKPRESNAIRVLLIGSRAFGRGLPETATPSKLLQDQLNLFHPLRSAGNHFEVINGGLPGLGTQRNYLFFRDRIAKLDPTVIVYMMSGHDVVLDVLEAMAFEHDRDGRPTKLGGRFQNAIGIDAYVKPAGVAAVGESWALTRFLWRTAFQGRPRAESLTQMFAVPVFALCAFHPYSGGHYFSFAPYRSHARDLFRLYDGEMKAFFEFISPNFEIHGGDVGRELENYLPVSVFPHGFENGAGKNLTTDPEIDYLTREGSDLWSRQAAQGVLKSGNVENLLYLAPPLHWSISSRPGESSETAKKPRK